MQVGTSDACRDWISPKVGVSREISKLHLQIWAHRLKTKYQFKASQVQYIHFPLTPRIPSNPSNLTAILKSHISLQSQAGWMASRSI